MGINEPNAKTTVAMDENADLEFERLCARLCRENQLALWAIMCSSFIPRDAEADATTARCRSSYTRGQMKRTIRRCRVAQSVLRREGDANGVAVFERAIEFIRREVMSDKKLTYGLYNTLS